MKPADFRYLRANSLDEAFAHHAAAGGEGIWLAGGHSLIPAMAMRLNSPGVVIDIGRLAALKGISRQDDRLRIGALTPHAALITDPLVAAHAPLLAQTAPFIAHPAIRNRATLGGNLALADPASELPAAILCLKADIEIAGPEGLRLVPAGDFFLDLYTTALDEGEILCAVHIPQPPPGSRFGFDEYARRHGDFAMAGAAVHLVMAGGLIRSASVCLHSVGPTAIRARSVEAVLTGQTATPDLLRAAAAALHQDIDPDDDPSLPGRQRRDIAAVLLRRLLSRICEGVADEASA